jgi:GrpB-like predicted nucleotidyltransferase (UPF0157 family)
VTEVRPNDTIHIVGYNPNWPALYEQERAVVAAAFGEIAAEIHHVGSTAVPGLSAKPIIDIMVAVTHLAPPEEYAGKLEPLGYEYHDSEEAGRIFFRKGLPRTHHVHVVERGSWTLQRHLLFRDYLRAHPQAMRQYAQLKQELAIRFEFDRKAYTQAKTEFVESIIAVAAAGYKIQSPG